MTVTCRSANTGRRKSIGRDQDRSERWYIDGTTDEDEALIALQNTSPRTLRGMTRIGLSVDETDASGHWEGSVTYGHDNQDDPTFTINIGTTTAHITQSLATVGAYTFPGRTVNPTYGVIGGQGDGSVTGMDKQIAALDWTETHYIPAGYVDRSYFNLLALTCCTMNAGYFRTFAPGEVLFVGGTLTKRRSSPTFEAQYKFLPLPNATGIEVGGISGIAKLGHDYLWVRYNQAHETLSKFIQPVPYEVFVERIYLFSDYNALRLPDPF